MNGIGSVNVQDFTAAYLRRAGSGPSLPRNFEQKLGKIELRRCRQLKVSLSWAEEVPCSRSFSPSRR